MVSYCINLSFYLLLKIKSKNVQDHPVLHRIIEVKTQLTKLEDINAMLEPQIMRILQEIEGTFENHD